MNYFDESTMNVSWGLNSRTKQVLEAVRFFSVTNYSECSKAIGKTPGTTLEPFSLTEFMTFLVKKGVFTNNQNAFRVI